jgi:uncharacterized protein
VSPGAHAAVLRLLRAAEQPAVPWKNGGGTTRELAVHPPGSDLERFLWRVSIATVAAPGPFSHFAGIERRMAILSGRLLLAIEGGAARVLTPADPPLEFPGEAAVHAEPQGGAVTDLNVMTRRGQCTAQLQRHVLALPIALAPVAATRLVVALADLEVRAGDDGLRLKRLDALCLAPGSGCELRARAEGAAVYVVQLTVRA